MPSKILLQDAISQCGDEIIDTIKDAIFPFKEHPFAKQIDTDLRDVKGDLIKDLSKNPFLQFRLAPSIVCRSEIELYSIYMPRFGVRIDLGGREGFGFLTFRRSKLLQKELEGAYKNNQKILNRLKATDDNEDSKFGKLADSVIRIPEIFTDTKVALKSSGSFIFWNVAQAELFKHYGGREADRGVPFVTHSDSSGGMCAQACLFMLQMYQIENLDKINGIADITYLAGTASTNSTKKDRIPLEGLKPRSVHDYVKNNFTAKCRLILSVHNLPDRSLHNDNKESLEHLRDTFPELGKSSHSAELVIQKIEVEAYARSQIPQIAIVDIGLLYDQQKTKPIPKSNWNIDERRPHAILIIGTKYHVDQDSGMIQEDIVLNDPATGPLRTMDTEFSLVECARYAGPAEDKSVKNIAAFESLSILPEGMTRQLAPIQTVTISDIVNRRKPNKHFTVGILEDLRLKRGLVREKGTLKSLILIAIQFSDNENSQSNLETISFVLANSALSKLKINILKTPNQMILKDISTFIGNKLKELKTTRTHAKASHSNWYWLACLPQRKGKQIQIHLRLYDASEKKMLAQTDQLRALDERAFSINL